MEDNGSMISGYLVALVALGVAGQWAAHWTRLPAVLWMLAFALIAGPVTGWLHPDEILGEMLLPFVSLSVAVILFEGSLELRFKDLPQIGRPLLGLLSVGMLITLVGGALLAHRLLGVPISVAALIGSILVVTGPTVIGPILATVRPSTRISQLLRWEGIAIDPLGAVVAVLVYESVGHLQSGSLQKVLVSGLIQLSATVALGVALGFLGSWLLTLAIRRFWIPDSLHGVGSLAILLVVFDVANRGQHEAGLLAATLMGVFTANRTDFHRERVERFHQNLSVLLIPTLFLLLGSRLQLDEVMRLGWPGILFVVVLMLLVRPLSVFVSTMGSALSWQEKTFAAFLAPRGIVAAAVSSLFALRLGGPFDVLVPVTFLTIVATVSVYSCIAGPLARLLGLSVSNPQGCLILGANRFGREVASALRKGGIQVLLVDTNRRYIEDARMAGLSTRYMNVLSDHAGEEEIGLSGLGNFLALTSNDEVNILACQHFAEMFGSKHVYQLPPQGAGGKARNISTKHVRGRVLFSPEATYEFLENGLANGFHVRTTKTSEKFTPEEFLNSHSDVMVLFVIPNSKTLQIFSPGVDMLIPEDATIISFRRTGTERRDQEEDYGSESRATDGTDGTKVIETKETTENRSSGSA